MNPENESDFPRWPLFVLAAGLVATIVPFVLYFALRGRLIVRAVPYTETNPDPRVVQGQISCVRARESFIRNEVLAPPVQVSPWITLWLVLASAKVAAAAVMRIGFWRDGQG